MNLIKYIRDARRADSLEIHRVIFTGRRTIEWQTCLRWMNDDDMRLVRCRT
jgi:hypothetical protein